MNKNCLYCKQLFKSKYSKSKFCSVPCSNRYNLNNKVVFKAPQIYSPELAELFGILLGDGSVEKYFTKIYLNRIADKGYMQSILRIIEICLPGVQASVTVRIEKGTEELQISSKDVCDYLRSIGFNPKERTIPDWILNEEKFIIATIRGLFDTEGSIGIKTFKGKNGTYRYKQLTFTNKNLFLLNFVEYYLLKLEFSPTKNSTKNIYISNEKDIKRYFKLIGTSNPKLVKKLKMGRMESLS